MQGLGLGSSLQLLCLWLGAQDQGISIDSSYYHSIAKINMLPNIKHTELALLELIMVWGLINTDILISRGSMEPLLQIRRDQIDIHCVYNYIEFTVEWVGVESVSGYHTWVKNVWVTAQSSKISPSPCEWRLGTLCVQSVRGTFPCFLSLRRIPDCCLLVKAARLWQDQLWKNQGYIKHCHITEQMISLFLYLKDSVTDECKSLHPHNPPPSLIKRKIRRKQIKVLIFV